MDRERLIQLFNDFIIFKSMLLKDLDFNLSQQKFRILVYIYHKARQDKKVSMKEIATDFKKHLSAISRSVNQLMKEHYLETMESADKRSKYLCLTVHTISKMDLFCEGVQQILDKIRDCLDNTPLKILLEVIEISSDKLKKEIV